MKISINGMSCAHCVKAVTRALSGVKGVSNVSVSLEDKHATLDAQDVSHDVIRAAIEDAGYDVVGISD